jgi:hypothetical protein
MNQNMRYDGNAGDEVTDYFFDLGPVTHTHYKVDQIKRSVSSKSF